MPHNWARARKLLGEFTRRPEQNQTTAAHALGVEPSWVSQFLAGKRQITKADVLVKMAALLGVEIDDLVPESLRQELSGATEATPRRATVSPEELDRSLDRLQQLAYDILAIASGVSEDVAREARTRARDQPDVSRASGKSRG